MPSDQILVEQVSGTYPKVNNSKFMKDDIQALVKNVEDTARSADQMDVTFLNDIFKKIKEEWKTMPFIHFIATICDNNDLKMCVFRSLCQRIVTAPLKGIVYDNSNWLYGSQNVHKSLFMTALMSLANIGKRIQLNRKSGISSGSTFYRNRRTARVLSNIQHIDNGGGDIINTLIGGENLQLEFPNTKEFMSPARTALGGLTSNYKKTGDCDNLHDIEEAKQRITVLKFESGVPSSLVTGINMAYPLVENGPRDITKGYN